MHKKALICLFVVAAIICPGALLAQPGNNLEEWLALIHLNGLNYSNPESKNERKYNRIKITYDNSKRRDVVLGSSRANHLDSKMLGRKVDNYWMSGATLEDILALYFILEQTGKKPGRIILALDPWLFNANNAQERWRELTSEYNQMVDVLRNRTKIKNKGNVNVAKQGDLFNTAEFFFSPSELDSSGLRDINPNKLIARGSLYDSIATDTSALTNAIKNLAHETAPYRNRNPNALEPYQKHNIAKLNRLLLIVLLSAPERDIAESFATRDSVNNVGVIYPDGGQSYPIWFFAQDSSLTSKQALTQVGYSVLNYKELDKAKTELFELFVEYLRKKKIEVMFFIAPYHQNVYKVYRSDDAYKNVLAFENYLIKLATQKKITIAGSYDPWKYTLDSSDFYDGMHLRRKAVAYILKHHGISYGK